MRLKTKLSLGTGFLFVAILISGILGILSIQQLKKDAELVLENNYETLVYNTNMLWSLEHLPQDSSARQSFEDNLSKQLANITEPGEARFTAELRIAYEALFVSGHSTDSLKAIIRNALVNINKVNQDAIFRKNLITEHNAEKFSTWLMIIFAVLVLLAFTLAVNFPNVISAPVKALSEGITAIVNKDYSKRIHLQQKDEFGDLANAFNTMAEKLDEYQHSNLARIKFEKSRIETIINQLNDGIIGLDENMHVLFLNKVSEGLLGLKEAAIAGKYAPDIALKNDLMRTLLQGNPKGKELKIFANNQESYFQPDTFSVTNNEKTIGQVIVLRNITPFHELNEAKTNFIATISHELKTPIASIKMSAQLLTDSRIGAVNKEQEELVKSIHDDANRLLKITGELLNMSQVETGHIQLKLQSVAPESITDEAIAAVQFLAQQKGIHFEKHFFHHDQRIFADPEKTAWVLTNFLSNAVKYAPEHTSVAITVSLAENRMQFTVKDLGMGIDPKYLPRLFDRYFKVPGALDKTGTGLGLSISKEFMEAQGGSVWAESHPGEGSIFGFSIPLA
ncbi:MAG: ATP-binding protein [Chitinophagaceae bacterium]